MEEHDAVLDGVALALVFPSEQWHLLEGRDARRIVPGSLVAASSRGGDADSGAIWGAIFVEQTNLSLSEDVPLVYDSLGEVAFANRADGEFLGLPAHHAEYRMNVDGTVMLYRRTIFQRDGYLFQIVSWGVDGRFSPARLPEFESAVRLLDGPVSGTLPVERVAFARGVTWEVRDNVFTGAATGLRIEPPSDWRLVVGREAEELGWGGGAVLHNPRLEAYVAIQGQAHGGMPEWIIDTHLREGYEVVGGVEDLPPGSLGDFRFEQTTFESDGLTFVLGAAVDDQRVLTAIRWFQPSKAEAVDAALEQLSSGITKLPEDERLALEKRLTERKDPRRAFVGSIGYDGVTVRDFTRSVAWRRPPGLFDVFIPPLGLLGNPQDQVVEFTAPVIGLDGELVVLGSARSVDLEQEHEQTANELLGRRDESGVGRRLTVGEYDGFRYVVSTVEAGRQVFQLTAGGPAGLVSSDLLETMGRGLGPLTERETVARNGVFEDHLYRVRAEAPGAGWTLEERVGLEGMSGRMVRWVHESGSFVILGVLPILLDTGDQAWLGQFMAQVMGEIFKERFDVERLEKGESELAGAPSMTLEGNDGLYSEIATKHQTAILLLADGLSAPELAAWRNGVQFIDP